MNSKNLRIEDLITELLEKILWKKVLEMLFIYLNSFIQNNRFNFRPNNDPNISWNKIDKINNKMYFAGIAIMGLSTIPFIVIAFQMGNNLLSIKCILFSTICLMTVIGYKKYMEECNRIGNWFRNLFNNYNSY